MLDDSIISMAKLSAATLDDSIIPIVTMTSITFITLKEIINQTSLIFITGPDARFFIIYLLLKALY